MPLPRPRPTAPARRSPGAVIEEDLALLPAIHELLFALDDPGAALARVEGTAQKLPPLAARVIERAQRSAGQLDLRAALGRIGNRGLEAVLLELLEDMTILKADLDDRAKAAASSA